MKKCQFCKKILVKVYVDLGFMPPVNVMYKINSIQDKLEGYPLDLGHCTNCGLVQITGEIKQEIVFPQDYPYLSGTTKSLLMNFSNQHEEVCKILVLAKDDLVVDIGSNDGSLLLNYKEQSRVLGVEPTLAAKISLEKGIPTLEKFFSSVIAEEIVKNSSKAKLITACNVFAHIPDLNDLLSGIDGLLSDDGIFLSESHYLFSLIEDLQFDTIYHEHLRYYSATFLTYALKKFNLEVFKIESIKSHGGSIRVWAARSGKFKIDESVKNYLEIESQYDLAKLLNKFEKSIIKWRHEFRNLISKLIIDGNTIAAIGAPSRASTLISFTGLTHFDIFAVAEISNSAKIGLYMPGTKIPVLEEDEVIKKDPDILLILSWHISTTLVQIFRDNGFKGKFLIPLPTPKIIN